MSGRKLLIFGFALLAAVAVVFLAMSYHAPTFAVTLCTWNNQSSAVVGQKKVRMDFIDNSGASTYLAQYEKMYKQPGEQVTVPADPNSPETIKNWWQAAAMIEWYFNTPLRHKCQNKVAMGNWYICQDEPYTVKPPCLVYSFGIAFDFSFDNAMANHGCEVHSFDPSMKTADHKRGNMSFFHNMGVGSINTDAYVPRSDGYVKDKQVWKVRTVKSIMRELGHENRVIDVFKMDVESYEWYITDNMMETDVFKYIRQFITEYHLFADFPLKEDYPFLFKILTKLRSMGFREFGTQNEGRDMDIKNYKLQSNCNFVNAFFERQPD